MLKEGDIIKFKCGFHGDLDAEIVGKIGIINSVFIRNDGEREYDIYIKYNNTTVGFWAEDKLEFIEHGDKNEIDRLRKIAWEKEYNAMSDVDKFKYNLLELKQWEQVSKEEYDKYLKEYDGELHNHSVYFCTPPTHGKYDFKINPTDSDATVCEVAYIQEGGWYNDDPEKYFVVNNIEEIRTFVNEYKEK